MTGGIRKRKKVTTTTTMSSSEPLPSTKERTNEVFSKEKKEALTEDVLKEILKKNIPEKRSGVRKKKVFQSVFYCQSFFKILN